ncbi:MAG: DNA-directed RNA polymerase subunit omega [Clostridiales bacterium]|jgi:DNA-directed RNA polymerase subunit omega|nr:DNA-directed RNA polymerase subunit omega [Clostridiales bacterium]
MLRPSYSELMDTINEGKLVDSKITSRYTIVLAAAKRARQIIDGANPLTYAPTDRAVSIAVREMSEGKLVINVKEDMLDGNYERMLNAQNKYKGITAVSKDDLREDLKDKYEPDQYSAGGDEDGDDEDSLYKDHYDDEKDPYKNMYEAEDYGDSDEE